ncbi:MAG: aldehyde dehydrogenase family protein [Fimbriimonadaceae bacterium]|nr:aldehyde dehydrogenase family protein [Fimbriimonadaceae bacterium]
MSLPDLLSSMEYGPAPESAALAGSWLDARARRFGLFVGGLFRSGSGGASFESYNPSTGQPIAILTQADEADVDRAVRSARRAQPRWSALGGHARARYLYALSRQIQKNARLFAVLETLDNGKPIRETRDIDVPLVARHLLHHAGWAQVADELMEREGLGPVGVCGQVIPWNFPLLMLAWKIAPALAMGNTVVLKPAEYTSLTALLFAETCRAVGLPSGVVNIVTGDGETGRAIVAHPGFDKVAFTGSTEVGRAIRTVTAGTGKKLSLELGGKSAFIVFEDADFDSAIEGLVDAIWFNQGQVCCAGSRLLIQEGVAERFLAKLRARMATLRVGDPLDKAVDIGAIVAPVQLTRIKELVEKGRSEGAELYQPPCACPSEGWFFPPTLLTNVHPASTVAQVEIFGPVLVAMTFRTPDEAVRLANDTVYGLAASVWTENVGVAHDVAARLVAGTVWVNCTNRFDAASGFGGYRESGFGREGGREGLYEYLAPTTEPSAPPSRSTRPRVQTAVGELDVTHKLYVGGAQVRPDSGYSLTIGGEAFARANRKDVRNAVEAARKAQPGWAKSTAHLRAQVLYYLAENLEAERGLLVEALRFGGDSDASAAAEFDATLRTLFEFAARADKYDGSVHAVPGRILCYTRNEPMGVLGVVCPDSPSLLGLVRPLAAGLAMGNAVVALASSANPLPAARLYRVLDASDVPHGVANLLTGLREEVVPTLADHDGIESCWSFVGDWDAEIERRSAGNLKRTWTGRSVRAGVDEFLRQATQVKNVWVPYGA